ncbi:MAG: 4-hydroxy-3-methylbut-2-enyl diphosphate reductase [Clostridia bacterium]|nr:4-hydroxy-3-methylbut-2-enyl diphosphate reductase [Clostridia bacterium]
MKVYVAKEHGFCAGVKHAVKAALTASAENTYLLGELIHNPEVTERVAARGIVTVERPEEVPEGARLLIRSHGVSKAVLKACKRRNLEVIDCTCPFVRRTQEIVARESAQGKAIVIAGHSRHPEVIGLVGWAEGEVYVTASEQDDFSFLRGKDVVFVAQTTFSEKIFCKIGENLQKVGPKSLVISPTICYTTVARQREAERLARLCGAIIVIGGRHSSNTERLSEIARRQGKRVIRIERAGELAIEEVINFDRVGVIAGASTPEWSTQEVLSKMVENNAEVLMAENAEAEVAEAAVKAEEAAIAAEETKAEEPVAVKSAMEKIMDDIDKEERYKKGQIIKVTIVSATDDGIFVSGSGKLENRIPKEELDCAEYSREAYEERAKNGEEIEVMVVAVKPTQLSEKMVKKLKEEEAFLADIEAGKEFTVVCTGTNKGGLTAELGTYPVFVPRKEIRMGYVSDLEKYKGKTLRLKLIEIRRERRKEIIASQRVVLEAERAARDAAKAAKEESFFSSIAVGDVVEGRVDRATTFGAFVSVNGFDCLAHISDLSWTGVKEVTDVLEIGKRYEFQVLKIDRANKKVSIGYKQLQPQPWDLAAEKYMEGDIVHGKVVRIVPFGAFVEIEKGIDGLVHVSQITHEWLENPTSALTIGEEVDAKILAFNPAERKITLSIKALQPRMDFERPERAEREEGAPRRERNRKGGRRAERTYGEEEEYREWTEGASFGASISELLGNDDK